MEPGHIALPRYAPKNRKPGCEQEEKRLREMENVFARYLDQAKSPQSGVKQRPAFVRGLYALTRQMGASLLKQTLLRALAYNVFDLSAIERITKQFIEINNEMTAENPGDTGEDYQKRSTYRDGQYTDENAIDYTQFE